MRKFLISLFNRDVILRWHWIFKVTVLVPLIICILTANCSKDGDEDKNDQIYTWPDSIPGKLVFTLNDGKNTSIFTLGANGLTQLTTGRNYSIPKWSPDDSKMVCLKFTGYYQDQEIHILNADGAGAHFINTYGIDPCWSPDGTKILYRTWIGYPYWMVDSSAKNWKFLGDFPGGEADWSPDGTKILFGNDGSTGLQGGIYQYNLNDSSLTQLTVGWDDEPEFSPEGNKIVYVHHDDDKSYITNIFVMNADGTNKINLTNYDQIKEFSCPTWSPHGTKIAFAFDGQSTGDSSKREVYIMNSDGSGLIRLDLLFESRFDWSNNSN
jgi:Tol biopolymer transport system component